MCVWGGIFFGTEKNPDEVQARAQIDRDPKLSQDINRCLHWKILLFFGEIE